jgi:ribosomal protein L14
MATLELKTLRCIRKQDVIRRDEPRIKVDGVKVWNGVVAKNGSVDIGVTVLFDDQASVIAEEMNNTKPTQIGDAVIVRESGNPKFLTFKTSGAWYEVDIEVT